MICFPNAKINLGLNIVSKREDGYHNLETIFYPLMIRDALEIIVKPHLAEDVFIQSGLPIGGTPGDNLVVKALQLMRTEHAIPPLEVHLLKEIPFGAGLGGGSADASFMLRLLNDTFSLQLNDSQMAAKAVRLGADCPFFVYNRPLFASGIGELFEEVAVDLSAYSFVLVKPDIHVSTKDAFAQVKPSLPDVSLLEIVKKPIGQWKDLMINDFEISVFSKYPQIKDIKQNLYDMGAVYASMSGSGSSVFGIFEKDTIDSFKQADDQMRKTYFGKVVSDVFVI